MGAFFVSLIHNNPKQNLFFFALTPNNPIIPQQPTCHQNTENQTVRTIKTPPTPPYRYSPSPLSDINKYIV
jgi:hypothetical protein